MLDSRVTGRCDRGDRDRPLIRARHPLSPSRSHLGGAFPLAVSLVSPVTPKRRGDGNEKRKTWQGGNLDQHSWVHRNRARCSSLITTPGLRKPHVGMTLAFASEAAVLTSATNYQRNRTMTPDQIERIRSTADI